ncbi:MAG: hypothetical protein AB7P69_25455, partial [Candidatus Binatia bacterium]
EKVQEAGENIPDTLRLLIEQQIERLEEQDQLLLDVASVSGTEFAAATVAAGLSTALETVEERCEQLVRKGQFIRSLGIEEWPDGAISGRYGFTHALYQQVLYERIAEARRVRLHRVSGMRKEQAYGKRTREIAGELAAHFAAGRDSQRAVTYSKQAAATAIRRHAHQEAVVHLQQGLSHLHRLSDTPERAQQELPLQITLGEQLTSLQGFGVTEVERAFARALELCRRLGETPQMFRVLLGLWAFYVERAELTTARELAEQLLRLAEHVESPAMRTWANLTMGITSHFAGDQSAARQHLEQSLACYDPQDFSTPGASYDPAVLGSTTLGPVLWLLGYPEQALAHGLRGLALARELTQSYSVIYAANLVIRTRLLRGEQKDIHTLVEELIPLCREQGFVSYLALSMIVQGWLLTEQGRQKEGIEQMRRELLAWRATGAESARPYYLALLAEIHGKAGAPDEGLSVLSECWPWMEKTQARVFEAELYRIRGELLLQQLTIHGSRFTVEDDRVSSNQRPAPIKIQYPQFPISLAPHAPRTTQNAAIQPSTLSSQPSSVFRREGEYWTLVFEGESCRMRDTRGLHYLAQLLYHPHEELHVLRLVTGEKSSTDITQQAALGLQWVDDPADARHASSFTDLGDLLDSQARAAYRRRIEDVQAEMEEAGRFHDQGRVDHLQDEFEFLARELAQAVGLGGQARRVGSPAERARVAVTKAIKTVLKKIHKYHPALGRHLTHTLKTGTYCSYTPDPRLPISWQL